MLGKCGGTEYSNRGSKHWKRHEHQPGGKDSSRRVIKGKEGQKHSRREYSTDAARNEVVLPLVQEVVRAALWQREEIPRKRRRTSRSLGWNKQTC